MRKALLLLLVLATSAIASVEVNSGGGSSSIGGTVTDGTAGSVLFIGSGPVMSQDNTNFFWDDTNNRLGLGTATPANPLQVVHAGTSGTAVVIQATATSGTGNGMTVQQSKPGQRGILVQHLATSGAGNAIEASVASGATGRVLTATQSGTGSGVLSTISNASSSAIANGGITNGTGQGVYGEVNGTGTGTGVVAVKTSTSGRAFAVVSGSTASYVSLNAQQTPAFTSYDLTLPNAQGGAGTFLQNDGSGVLSWAFPTAPSIGGTLTSATAGSVLFAGSGTFAQDNANLFWDNTNDRLGIGTATPSESLHVTGTSNVAVRFTAPAGFQSSLYFEELPSLSGFIQYKPAGVAAIRWYSNDTATDRMALLSTGELGVGTTTPLSGSKIDAAGQIYSSGASSGLSWVDRDDPVFAAKGWFLYSNASSTRIYSTAAASDVFSVTTAGRADVTRLGVLEGGGSPSFHTILQGGDQSGDVTYTLPTAAPSANSQVLKATTGGVMSWGSVTWETDTDTTSATCSITCSAGKATGGGCTNTMAISLQKSYQTGGDTWNCEYATALGDCTAQVSCL